MIHTFQNAINYIISLIKTIDTRGGYYNNNLLWTVVELLKIRELTLSHMQSLKVNPLTH